ncbi:MAG: hypothetical protein Q7S44_02950 [bacterium]|nr:hypothetical protein [bacterium]
MWESMRRSILTAADVVCTASVTRGQKNSRELAAVLFKSSSWKSDRLLAALNLLGNYIPNAESLIARLVFEPSKMPFLDTSPLAVGRGWEQAVFSFQVKDRKYALKINRESIGLNGEALSVKARQVRMSYQRVKTDFGDIPGLVPEEMFLIVHSHLRAIRALAVVQPYMEGELRDFFTDFTMEQLVATLTTNQQLCRQFIPFAERVLGIYQRLPEEFLDIGGYRNLSVVSKGGEKRLILLDPHTLPVTVFSQLEFNNRIERIDHILAKTKNRVLVAA